MVNFPSSLDSLTNPAGGDHLNSPDHAAQHSNANDAIEAIEAKLGIGASTAASGKVLRGTGGGQSSWSIINPATDIDTMTSAQFAALLTDEVGSSGGFVVFNNAPAITAPVITGGGSWTGGEFKSGVVDSTVFIDTSATQQNITLPVTRKFIVIDHFEVGATKTFELPPDATAEVWVAPFTNSFSAANHTHQNTAGGGTLAPAAMPALDMAQQTTSNPYQFNAYITAAFNYGNNGVALVALDSEVFDTNNDFNTTTHRYVCSVAGIYWVYGIVQCQTISGAGLNCYIYKNGAGIFTGGGCVPVGYTGNFSTASSASGPVSLAVGDYLELGAYGANNTGAPGNGTTYLSGFMISRT